MYTRGRPLQGFRSHPPLARTPCRHAALARSVSTASRSGRLIAKASTEEGDPQSHAEHQSSLPDIDPLEARELEIEELDSVQEQMLKWMTLSEQEQQDDLDEMVAYDEFGDEEYGEELCEELEQLIEAADVQLKLGDRVLGTVYAVDDDGAYVELGLKYSGFVPVSECSFARLRTALEVLRVGMTREFIVAEDVDTYDQVVLSLAATEASIFWQRMRQLQEEAVVVSARVTSANRGGLLLQYGPCDGFLPVTQFGPSIRPDSMETLVGSELPVIFLEVDENQERLVFSNKRAAAAVSSNTRGLKTGDVCEGVVQSIRPYGAFLDLGGGMLGLLHVSQISHERVGDVHQVMRQGDRLKVMVLSVDPQRGRVALSTKKLEPMRGDMLRNPARVYEQADQMAAMFKSRIEAAQRDSASLQEQADLGDIQL